MTHTPGPWTVEPESGGYVVFCEEYEIAVITPADDDSESIGSAEADAWLIGASPDLIAALKDMVTSYDGLRDTLTSPVVLGKLARADAAIAKAEGR